jgi:O-antigen ligase
MADDIPFNAARNPLFALRACDVQFYRACDDLSGLVIFPMIVFSPWAFGTTEPWSIRTMNVAGFALGILLLAKLFIRKAKNYPAPRWEHFSPRKFSRALAWLALAILGYCLVSALNARATYDPATKIFDYHRCINWLPHSMDSRRSWAAFWNYSALACSFWAIRDWLLGMTPGEQRPFRGGTEKSFPILSARLRWLLWLLCLNGALFGIEGIVQRASGSDKLLFLVHPLVNPEAESQFGAYHYRSNAAQYFDLLWPLCLGFWWTLHRLRGSRHKLHHLLLLCAAIMAACPIISGGRGGAIVDAGLLLFAMIFFPVMNFFSSTWRLKERRSRRGAAILLGLFFAIALALGWYFGWNLLSARMADIRGGYQEREQMYEAARPMTADYPIFGTGPGTFGTVFQLYRYSYETYWPEQLHNDWLETRITFGWVGMAMILSALACVGLRWFAPGGIRGGRRFVILAWAGLAGCLLQARFDFPFQIYSILFLFLVICAMLFNLSSRSGASRSLNGK